MHPNAHLQLSLKLNGSHTQPMPPWNPILGHLLAVPPVMKTLPEDTQQPDAFEALCRAHSKEGRDSIIYLDMWPFADPMMVVCSPGLAVQACQEQDLPKPPILHAFFNPLAGGDNLFTMNGAEWKRSRALFNSGFSAGYILQQTPHIVDEAEVYVEVLREHARHGDMFSLDDVTCWYTMDIIGAVTLDSRLQSQRQHNPLATAMRRQIRWHVLDNEWNLFIRWNPARPFVQWYNNQQMDAYIAAELDKRYAEWREDESAASSRSIIHLALAGYMATQTTHPRPPKLDAAFKRWATIQIRLFLFAGHDSTSSTICYCFLLLQRHPEALAKLIAEHNAVFGTDLSQTSHLLRTTPNLLNNLPYTTAVIKESLRLFPPASAMRGGLPNSPLTDTTTPGTTYPTEGTNLWMLHSAIHRNPSHWPSPDAFLPERWLTTSPSDPLHPPKGGWRPFEHGPRNCLGQTLAMLDVKVTLVMAVRELEVCEAYAEWDALHLKDKSKVKRVRGERAYQTQVGGAHPADGFPARVRVRR